MSHNTKVYVLNTFGHMVPWQEQGSESCVQAPVPEPAPQVTLGKSLNLPNFFLSGQLFCQPC